MDCFHGSLYFFTVHSWCMKRWAGFFLLVYMLSGCMSKYVYTLTDKQVQERYAPKTTQPFFGYFNSNGQNIFYALQGDASKPLLVLVHGAPGRWYSSINLFDDSLLLSRYRILAFDRPGYGKSGSPKAITSIETQTEYMAALVNHVNTTGEPVTIAGRSYGTPIAACYAMKYPEQVKKLVLLGSCIDPAKEKYFWFSYANLPGLIQSFMPRAINIATGEKFTHRKELKKLLSSWNHIQSPTMVVHGKKDWISDTANAWFAYKKIVNAPVTLYLLPESGHNITFSNASLIVDLILQEETHVTSNAPKGTQVRKR